MKQIVYFLIIMSTLLSAEWRKSVNITSQKLSNYTLIAKDPTTGLIMDHLLTDVLIAAWGYKHWKWGESSFHFQSEGWFEESSKTGGSDKTGHFYMTYLLSRIMASRMEDRGWNLHEASLAGALSGMLAMTFLEIGDGTSPYGFSKEDFIADGIGAGLAYLLRVNPRIDDFVDIRLEYLPTSGYLKGGDNTTDYSGMRHLAAFKVAGFESLKYTHWSLIEFQVGYYSRGYRSYDDGVEPSQHLYAGIGISLSNLAERSEINILKNLFEFYQPGHTYIDTDIWSR